MGTCNSNTLLENRWKATYARNGRIRLAGKGYYTREVSTDYSELLLL